MERKEIPTPTGEIVLRLGKIFEPGKDLYFGPLKIKEMNGLADKTYLGNPRIRIVFENGEESEMPLEMFEKVASTTATDLTNLRDKKVKPIIEKMMAILVESELAVEDVAYIIGNKLPFSLNDALDRANEKMWGKPQYKLSYMDIEKVLRKEKNGKPNDSENQPTDKPADATPSK